eukprot:gb/GECG01013359.1/.p1 GENE.gb/GECG01013359.1/~~gb/GECG01013359.1/.p1  ORF type:complete len:520 (+),score=70.00 gb/GECG01013359.1/:1-1560(+)
MGGACSKGDASPGNDAPHQYEENQSNKNLARDKGSSIITRKGRRDHSSGARGNQNNTDEINDDFLGDALKEGENQENDTGVPGGVDVSKGGSFVFPSKGTEKASWHPGDAIERPEDCPRTQFLYVNLEDQTQEEEGKEPKKLLQLTYGYSSVQGVSPKPPQKANQDSLVVLPKLGNRNNLSAFAVFDGHGPRGEDASHFCRLQLENAITHQKEFQSSPAKGLQACFPALHRELIRSCKRGAVEMAVSGSTAVAVLFDGDRLICANVGDSRAVLCSYIPPTVEGNQEANTEGQASTKDVDVDVPEKEQLSAWNSIPGRTGNQAAGRWISTALSSDHKPDREDERARIEATNARILSEAQLVSFGDPDKLYICRESEGMIRYGVLFTRSIGDVDSHTHLGLTDESEVHETRLEKDVDRFVILATDGIWDAISNVEAAAIISRFPRSQAQEACNELVETAKKRWGSRADTRRDDITAIVIGLKWITRSEDSEHEFEQARSAPLPAEPEGTVAGAPGKSHSQV